jgi:type IV secretory pathway VirB9-like protein
MTEPNPAEAEAPIEDVGEGPAEHDSDNPKAVVDENDRLVDFISHDGEQWPDDLRFEKDLFLPPDEGVK